MTLGWQSNSDIFLNFRRLAAECKIGSKTYDVFRRRAKLSPNKVTSILAKLLIDFSHQFKQHIWRLRCSNMAAWEKSHGILQGDKYHHVTTSTGSSSIGSSNDKHTTYAHKKHIRLNKTLQKCWIAMDTYIRHNIYERWYCRYRKTLNKLAKRLDLLDNG
jgi:hypothetical protein